jgi:pyruvate dehydrogenase E1 component alpha subunit
LAENPLLPHAQLRALYASMVETRGLERRAKVKPAGAREALLAATTIHLQAGDLVCASAGDGTVERLAPAGRNAKLAGGAAGVLTAAAGERLAVCAGAARGLQASAAAAGEMGLVLAFAQAGVAEAGWEAALTWAQQADLPLVLAVADASGGKAARKGAMDWAAATRLARRTKLPVISVDGEDAVAIYRVMQECVLRARLGLGPAVIWGVMGAETKSPVVRLRGYMRVRGIAVE